MILVDANLLIHAYNADSPFHEAAGNWLEKVLSGSETVGLPWIVLLAFLRISTHKKVFPQPLAMTEAEDIVTNWLKQPGVEILNPGEKHWSILRKLLSPCQVRGPLVMDAHLAALALAREATLYTTDNDFERFTELRWKNPLA